MLIFVFFFFQAEDGIRDRLVTGVQTCALPIFGTFGKTIETNGFVPNANIEPLVSCSVDHYRCQQIGRASCRERV